MKHAPHLAVTLGDPCGIGPELLLKLLPIITQKWQVTVYGSYAGLSILPDCELKYEFNKSKLLFHSLEIPWIDPLSDISRNDLQLGVPSACSGKCAVEAVRSAALDVISGKADALLTLPISKAAAHMAGYDIPGHTELLQSISASPRVQMAFISPSLKVVLHTVHQSLRSVIEGLDSGAVADTLIFAAQQLAPLLKNNRIKIALCALNPHAGECGAFGDEEKILEESVKIARNSFNSSAPSASCEPDSIQPAFCGPYPADTIFLRAFRGAFDVVVALYHDQGLIPVKLIEPEKAVNLTLGLPFIRTSPDHGVAFDIVGKWIANPNNALAASDLAYSLLR
ncbi:MAG: 4-hydroxythreonine-4-phosphate dehydrogenase PdxA [Holophagales bacterium]|jgi:4-hydroxythreonine-4-phosphate dehydrogenase|nr:4-hydroxythreonine-4-phosphate dehydrogenase PdxA [Holophagales bacterium]